MECAVIILANIIEIIIRDYDISMEHFNCEEAKEIWQSIINIFFNNLTKNNTPEKSPNPLTVDNTYV